MQPATRNRMMQLVVDLAIGREELKRLYTGQVRDVYAHARDGRSVRFPADWLRHFVSDNGVHGTFLLSVAGSRMVDMQRLR